MKKVKLSTSTDFSLTRMERVKVLVETERKLLLYRLAMIKLTLFRVLLCRLATTPDDDIVQKLLEQPSQTRTCTNVQYSDVNQTPSLSRI